LSDESGAVSDESGDVLDESGAISDASGALSDESGAVSDESGAISDESAAVDKVKIANAVSNQSVDLDVLDLRKMINRLVAFINSANDF
jgi:hypothetical protein